MTPTANTTTSGDAGGGGWGRTRLLAMLVAGLAAVVLFVAGLGLAVLSGWRGTDAATPETRQPPRDVATVGTGKAHRDAVAAAPMARVEPGDARGGTPAAVPGPAIQVPPATRTGPARVPTGFPRTPAGAVGQLAAIQTTVLAGMSIPQANQVYREWALPGGVGVAGWALTKNVQSFLAAAGQGPSKQVTVAVTATPAAAQVKGVDGSDWVLACVLLDVRAVITRAARIGYGHCEAMQWTGPDGPGGTGRWMIAPGPPAAPAPSVRPGTELAYAAGWRTWVDSPTGVDIPSEQAS